MRAKKYVAHHHEAIKLSSTPAASACRLRPPTSMKVWPSTRRSLRAISQRHTSIDRALGSPRTLPHSSYDGPHPWWGMVLVGPSGRDHKHMDYCVQSLGCTAEEARRIEAVAAIRMGRSQQHPRAPSRYRSWRARWRRKHKQ